MLLVHESTFQIQIDMLSIFEEVPSVPKVLSVAK